MFAKKHMLGVAVTNSAYVVRVGGLAVALGIGAAVATGHEPAWAETPDSSSEAGGTSTSSVSDSADSTAAVAPRQPATHGKSDAGVLARFGLVGNVVDRRRRTPGMRRRRSPRWNSVTVW